MASATRTRRQTHCGDQSGAFQPFDVYGTYPESGYCLRVPSTLLIPFCVYRFFNAENSAQVRCLKICGFSSCLSFLPCRFRAFRWYIIRSTFRLSRLVVSAAFSSTRRVHIGAATILISESTGIAYAMKSTG